MTDRDIRARIRVIGGAVRRTAVGLEFYRSARASTGSKERVTSLVAEWVGDEWRAPGVVPVPCPDAGVALDLFLRAVYAAVGDLPAVGPLADARFHPPGKPVARPHGRFRQQARVIRGLGGLREPTT
jgi:hypothetical protein